MEPSITPPESSKLQPVAILLMKMTVDDNSKTYMDFTDEKEAINGIHLIRLS